MKKWIIMWNAGCGDEYDEIEALTKAEADNVAYECWREEAENNADYKVIGEATKQLREDYLG